MQTEVISANGNTGVCNRYCKKHYEKYVLTMIRKELKNLYRAADRAYSSLDFNGRGFITEEDFLNSLVCKRLAVLTISDI